MIPVRSGLFSERFGAPTLLVFLVIGMLVGEDGPIGIHFDNFHLAYLVGSAALAVILFEGGLKTKRKMIHIALWPALALATAGVALTCGIVGAIAMWYGGLGWPEALLIGAAVAPTDAAAVSQLLRRAKLALPPRVNAVLEIESGLNDPMSVFLTLLLVQIVLQSGTVHVANAILLFIWEMGGGAALGVAAGYAMITIMRRMHVEMALYPVLSLAGALFVFGGVQALGASGFLAVYLMGIVMGLFEHKANHEVESFFEAFSWTAQIVLFLMLGLLVTPHNLLPVLIPSVGVVIGLMLIARPAAVFACLLPFGFSAREMTYVSWVGLRGAVPIYLTIIPVLEGTPHSITLFGATFVMVIVSLIVQGWTVAPMSRLLGFSRSTK